MAFKNFKKHSMKKTNAYLEKNIKNMEKNALVSRNHSITLYPKKLFY